MELKELAIVPALGAGFAGLDTAPTYKNEQAVGRAMQQVATRGRPVARAVVGGGEGSTGVAEGSIGFDERPYLIVKVPGRCKYAPEVRVELMASLAKLGRPKCDLLLLHWPHAVIEAGTLGEVWGAMEAAVHEGLVDSLGVCNFTARALATLLDEPLCTIPPAVNQIERHPLLPQWELLEACRQSRIIVQAHTPLGHGASRLLAHPVVTAIAAQCGLSAAQVLLRRWIRARDPPASMHVLTTAPPLPTGATPVEPTAWPRDRAQMLEPCTCR
jgi:diketogulonate reductase-like aldo/keto reductase